MRWWSAGGLRTWWRIAAGAVLLAGVACSSSKTDDTKDSAGDGATAAGELPAVTFTKAAGGTAATLAVEVADDDEERSCGLMHRTSMPDDRGMLFVFAQDGQMGGFWMRNTLIPLAIAYIGGDGRIVDILEMRPVPSPGTPFKTADGQEIVVPDGQQAPPGAAWVTYPPRGAYRYAIEANKEWYARHGVAVGDRVDVSAAVAGASAAEPEKICLKKGR
jgi:uncharacterized membrane protein (UPF0127 family)